jgi:DNA repair exonuclease SbcCD ATPase subunit
MSDDIKNFRIAVEKFDELMTDLSVLESRLKEDFKHYKEAGEAAEKMQAILKNINAIQVNAETVLKAAEEKATAATEAAAALKKEMGKHWSAEFTETRKEFDKLLSEIKAAIADAASGVKVDTRALESTINKTLNEKIESFDITPLNRSIKLLHDLSESLKNRTNDVSAVARKIDSAIKNIEEKTEELNEASEKIDSIRGGMTFWTGVMLVSVGMIIGFFITTYYKIDALSDYYFAGYEKRLAAERARNDALEKRLDKSDGLIKFIEENGIKYRYGVYSDTKRPYIGFYNTKKDATFDDNGWHYVGFPRK